MDAWKLSTSLL